MNANHKNIVEKGIKMFEICFVLYFNEMKID